jgi:hypothetical protein
VVDALVRRQAGGNHGVQLASGGAQPRDFINACARLGASTISVCTVD